MEPPTTLEARSIVEEPARCSGRSPTSTRPTSSAANTPATAKAPSSTRLADGDFIARRAGIDNGAGPACRSSAHGKRLGEQRRLLTIGFRSASRRAGFSAPCARSWRDYGPDHISFDLGYPGASRPAPGQVPGPQMLLGQPGWSSPTRAPSAPGPRALRALLYDAMLGDRTLFTDARYRELWAHPVRWSRIPRHCPLRARLLRSAEMHEHRAATLVAAGTDPQGARARLAPYTSSRCCTLRPPSSSSSPPACATPTASSRSSVPRVWALTGFQQRVDADVRVLSPCRRARATPPPHGLLASVALEGQLGGELAPPCTSSPAVRRRRMRTRSPTGSGDGKRTLLRP